MHNVVIMCIKLKTIKIMITVQDRMVRYHDPAEVSPASHVAQFMRKREPISSIGWLAAMEK